MGIIHILYMGTGVLLTLAFVPQIARLWRDTTGAASTSLASWALFASCSVITLLYATQANHDPYFIATAALGAIGNLSVLSMAGYKRLAVIRSK